MANRWGNNVNSERLYLGGPKSPQMVTAVMKLKDAAPWKKSYEKPRQSRDLKKPEKNLKSRDITLQTKVCLVKAMVFPVVMYGCESWTIKKAECRRTDAFELWCWRRQLRVPWTARKSNQSVPKDVNPECSLEGLMLKLQYFGHLMRKANSLEKTLMLGRRRRGWRRMRGLDGITNSMDTEFEQTLGDIEDWRALVHGVAKSWTQLNDWTATTNFFAGYLTIEPKQQKKQAYFICFPPVGWIWVLLVGWDQVCIGFCFDF